MKFFKKFHYSLFVISISVSYIRAMEDPGEREESVEDIRIFIPQPGPRAVGYLLRNKDEIIADYKADGMAPGKAADLYNAELEKALETSGHGGEFLAIVTERQRSRTI